MVSSPSKRQAKPILIFNKYLLKVIRYIFLNELKKDGVHINGLLFRSSIYEKNHGYLLNESIRFGNHEITNYIYNLIHGGAPSQKYAIDGIIFPDSRPPIIPINSINA